ncbi:MAG: aromatic ring-hydroxylating dioxygenase subunit alpha [Sneathiella sp.]|uniref:aromatic ring-hydroxylating oxygenase subunit alpha n=1 Tax=Sneathiella sp. TaxID=1964365 RepID=UPI003003697B
MPRNTRLPRESYVTQEWFEHERKTIFDNAWAFIGVSGDFGTSGDYQTVRSGTSSMMVIAGNDDELKAFHNLCRHRGTELLDEEKGNVSGAIVCPYHRWTYGLDGALRGLPKRSICFPDIDLNAMGLKPAAIGIYKDLIFINPNPDADFDKWIEPLLGKEWPHDLFASDVKESVPLIYDLKCDWKIFVENALDGYHLAYLHKNTLGGPLPEHNIWERAGDHLIWYATEDGARHRLPMTARNEAGTSGTIESAKTPGYGGVYYLFPLTLIVPTPYGLSISMLHPSAPGRCRMTVRNWVGPWQSKDERKYIQGFNGDTGIISSDNWTKHPLECGDFQTEDVWICEKLQRGMESSAYEHGPLAKGAGAEDPIEWFHETLLSNT